MRIIAGLGNPGEKYELTKHNAGFMALNALAKKLDLVWQTNKKLGVAICRDQDTILIKPLTYMNNSGQAVRAVLSYYKLLPKKLGVIKIKNSDLSNALTIIHDDVDICLGEYKISVDSGSAGHKGVQSVIDYLKTKNFKRIRIGIRAKELADIPTQKFVLQKFRQEELKIINNLIEKLVEKIK